MAFSTTVTINGTDVTSYVIEYTIVDTTDDFSTAEIIMSNSVRDLIDLDTQSELIVTRTYTTTSQTLFHGYVNSIKKASSTNIDVDALDKLWILQRKSLTKTYDINIDTEAGVISAIAEDIITEKGGLTASVVSTGTLNVLDKFYCLNNSLKELLDELKDLVDYQLYYNPEDDTVYFQPVGYTDSGITLTVGGNVSNIPIWEYDYNALANIVTLTGDYQELETTDTFDGTGSKTVFQLSKTPESVKVYVDSVLQTGGVVRQTSAYDYSVDKENRYITFTDTSIPGADTDNVVINYSYLEPIVVTQKNSLSRSKFGDYAYNKYIDTIKTTADAEIKIQEIIDKFASPPVKTVLNVVKTEGLQAGLKVNIVDSYNNENRQAVIKRVTYHYPEVQDEVEVDTYPVFYDYVQQNMINSRIDKLERKNQSRGDLVVQRFAMQRDPIHFRRKTIKAYKKTIAGSTGIYGHPVQGIYGLAYYGQSGMIWGHSTFGVWGLVNWGTVTSSFILGHGYAGLLGTSKLGAGNQTEEVLFYSKTYTY